MFLILDEECTNQPDNQDCELFSAGFEMQHLGGEETRHGYISTIEWAPTDNFVLKADAFISRFESEEFARGFRVITDDATIFNPILSGRAVIGGTVILDVLLILCLIEPTSKSWRMSKAH